MADGKVIIDTQVNSKGIKTGVKEAQDAIKGFSVSSVAAFAGITLGIGAVVIGLKNLIVSTLATADRVDKLSQKIGISTKAFQEWDYVLSQSGIDIGVLQPGMKTLNDLLTSAAKGSTEAQATFNKLGLSWEKINKMNPDDRLNAIIEALQNIEDPVKRSSMAVDLLGKAATELNVIFNTSSQETKRLKDEAHSLGLVLSEDLIKKGVEAGDAAEDLKKSWGSFADMIILHVAPALTALFAALTPGTQLTDLKVQLSGITDKINYLKTQVANPGEESWFDKLFGNSKRAKENIAVLEEQKKAIQSQIAVMEKANGVHKNTQKNSIVLTDEQIAANKALEESYKNLGLNMTLAIGTGMESVGEALVNGGNVFKSFAQTAGSAIADVVSALGNQTIATGIANKDYGMINEGMSLKLLAGVIKATAGKFENGGIVPGNSTTGDRLLARVNSGELILNKAQQGNLASQLTATAKTNVNIQNYAGADVSVNQNGANLDVIIQKQVLKTLGSQRGKRTMSATFGARAMGIKRG